jgi:hypothetical protein
MLLATAETKRPHAVREVRVEGTMITVAAMEDASVITYVTRSWTTRQYADPSSTTDAVTVHPLALMEPATSSEPGMDRHLHPR